MPDIQMFERSTRYAFWSREWKDIAAPIHRLELSREQMAWLDALACADAAVAPHDEGLVAELMDLVPDGHSCRVWVGDLACGRQLIGGGSNRRSAVHRLLGAPWLAVRRAVRDALRHDYPLYLNVLDEDRFPPCGWWRCLLRDGRLDQTLCVMPGADADAGRRALTTITGSLLAGAPAGGAVVADIALSGHEGSVRPGLLSAAPAPNDARLGVDLLRRWTDKAPAGQPAPGGVQSDNYWITLSS